MVVCINNTIISFTSRAVKTIYVWRKRFDILTLVKVIYLDSKLFVNYIKSYCF